MSTTTTHEAGFLMQHGEFEMEESGCCCFQSLWPRMGTSRIPSNNDQLNLLPQQRRENKESWVVSQLKKLKETSELVAGPKWKNLIRKIGGYFNKKNRNDFQYDSFNYTLNFDNGIHDDEEDTNIGFSSRFAPPVVDKPKSST